MKKVINQTHIEGYLYEHNLEKRVSGSTSEHPNTTYITGDISIATDNDCTNIVKVYYRYVTQKTSKGKDNPIYPALLSIIEGTYKTVMNDGKEKATMLRIDSTIGLNDFYNDKEELISTKRNDGGFIHVTNKLNEKESLRNTFTCDMVITKTIRKEANEEKDTPEKVIVKGAIFNNYTKALLPVDFTALNPNAMDYFEGLEASSKEPVFTKIQGEQISTTVVRKIVEESAFGADFVTEVSTSNKDFVITKASKEPYIWDSEESITEKEYSDAIAEREVYLANVKKRRDDYLASKNKKKDSTPTDNENDEFKF